MSASEVADALYAAMRAGSSIDIAPRQFTPAEGAAIRRLVARRFARDGHPVVGHKIGLGSADARASYGVTESARGYLFRGHVLDNGAEVSAGEVPLLVEAEVAVTMARDVTLADVESDARLLDAVAYAQTAIEVVGSRWRPSPGGSIGAWMADDGMAVRAVLGGARVPFAAGERAVSIAVGSERREDRVEPPVAQALRWLVRDLAADGEQLRQGMVVLTGALLAPLPAEVGADVEVQLDGYGSASARIGR